MRSVQLPKLAAATVLAISALVGAAPARACTITVTAVAFGAYDPRSASPRDGTGAINLACPTNATAPAVSLSAGLYAALPARQLGSGVDRLNYNLYSDSTRTAIWGDGTSGTSSVTLSGGTLSGGTLNFSRTVYGRIPALQNVKVGAYGDTVTVTVTF